MRTNKYTFSGHESFPCKTLWLKKGYDFVKENYHWNDPEAVIRLGVGKNMVASIRYWMKTFGLIENDELTTVATYLFDSDKGVDPYIEDLGTLWLLHYLLTSRREATLYSLMFMNFQRERLAFNRQQVISFVRRRMTEDGKLKAFNENTVKKDVSVFLQNYVLPQKVQSSEDYSSLLTDLDLICLSGDGKQYQFNTDGKRKLPVDILFYAILDQKYADNSMDYETLQTIGNIFCLNDMELISMLIKIQEKYSNTFRYSDTAGLRQVQILKNVKTEQVLKHYYEHR